MASAHADITRADPLRRPSRPRELEDPLNLYVYHPLATRLARALVPTGISPNAVSVCGGLLIVAATFAYTQMDWPQGVLLGFTCHLLWHIVDGADGDLARLTGRTSATGELIDGLCDYTGHIVMYVAFAFLLDDTLGVWAWVLAVAAGASHILQTNHAESQRRAYLWWAYGVPWLKNAETSGDDLFARRSWFSRSFGHLATFYVRLSGAMNPGAAAIDARLEAAAGDPRESRRIRLLVRRSAHMSVFLQKALGANPKTIIIGLSMAFGSPLWFFLTEIFVLNLLLVISVRYHNRANRHLAALLSRA